ncbi:MAG: hypothetical protein IIC50_22270 [Planctomycetes bacterium]|nr:hypothetical protein [Planctomycetota bacterium]
MNSKLLEIERVLNVGLTALSAIDDWTIYPHQQVLADANGLKTALAALRADIPDRRTALQALESIGETILGTKFSYEVYQKLLARKHPNFQNLQWASMGKLPIPVDVMTEYRAIKSGEFTAAIATLESKHEQQIVQLNKRLQDMTTVLNRAQRLLTEMLAIVGLE